MSAAGDFAPFLPATLRTTLWDYQRDVVARLQAGFTRHDFKGMLCCEKMGAGKTLAALATTIGISEQEAHAKTDMRLKLVVGPTSAIEAWTRDCRARFLPPVHALVVGGCSTQSYTVGALRKDTFVLVNYSTFIRAYKTAFARRSTAAHALVTLMASKHLPSDRRVTWARTYLQYLTTTRSLWVPGDAEYCEFIATELLDREADLANAHSTLLDDNLFSIEWEWMVVDEAHEARNHTGCTFAALQSALTHRRLALSATPYNNRISDFMSILELLHAAPPGGWSAVFERGWDVGQLLEYLNRKKRELMICSDYAQVQQMYARFNTQRVAICVPFATQAERDAYQEKHAYFQKHQQSGGKTVIFQAITELRRLCDGPTKIVVAEKYARDVLLPYREKAVFFVWHVSLCQQIAARLRTLGRRLLVEEITGHVTPAKRTAALGRLERHDGAAVLVTTIQAMSLGVNMPFLHHAVVLTTWWNPMVVAQAKDRIRRPQQKRSPRIVEVVIDGTVEKTIDLVSFFKWKFNHQLLYGEITRKMLVPITSKKAMERRIHQMASDAGAASSSSGPTAFQMSEEQIMRGIARKKKRRGEGESRDGGDAVFQHMVFDAGSGGSGQRGLLEMIDFFFSSSHFDGGAREVDEAEIRRRIWGERCDVLIGDLAPSFADCIPRTTPIETAPRDEGEQPTYREAVLAHHANLKRKRKRERSERLLTARRADRAEGEELRAKRQATIRERRTKYGSSNAVERHYSLLSDAQRAVMARRNTGQTRQTIRIPI